LDQKVISANAGLSPTENLKGLKVNYFNQAKTILKLSSAINIYFGEGEENWQN
jgi:hypothetical protein